MDPSIMVVRGKITFLTADELARSFARNIIQSDEWAAGIVYE